MSELRDRASVIFMERDGVLSSRELAVEFSDAEIDWLIREGLIEMTAQPDMWAWKCG